MEKEGIFVEEWKRYENKLGYVAFCIVVITAYQKRPSTAKHAKTMNAILCKTAYHITFDIIKQNRAFIKQEKSGSCHVVVWFSHHHNVLT